VTLLHRFTVRYYAHDWLRTILTLLGVGLGLSVLVAIQIANRSALASFQNFTATVGARADFTITSNGPPLDETLLKRLSWAQGQALFHDPDEILELTGLDLLQDWQFTPVQGDTPTTGLLTDPQAVFIADTLAARLHLHENGPLTVTLNGHPVTLTVRGIVHAHAGLDDSVVLVDIAAAQQVMDREGQLDRIDIKLEPGVDKNAFLQHARQSLPGWLSIDPPTAAQGQAEKMTRAFQLNLTALSLVALMVGMFLVYNTVAVSVVRRRPEIGIMRALGTDRQTIFGLFLLEGGVLGAVGSLLGLAFGWALSFIVVKAVAQTVDLLYVPVHDVQPVLDPWLAMLAWVLGVGMALMASAVPAWEAASVPPAEAMGRGAQHRLDPPGLRASLIMATLFVLIAMALCRMPPWHDLPIPGFLACLFVLLTGAVLSGPSAWLISTVLKRPLVTLFQAPGMAAVTHLLGALKRIAVAVGALTVGMAMVASVAVMIDSFRATVVAWVDETVKADIFITAADNRSTIARGTLNPETVRDIRALPGIRSSDAFYGTRIIYEGEPAWLGAGDFNSIGEYGHLKFMHGDSNQVIQSCIDQPRVIVSEPFATRHHVQEGDTVTLQATDGPVPLTIAGVYYDYSSEAGWVVLDKGTFEKHLGPAPTTNLAIYLQPGVAPDEFRRLLRTRLGPHSDLDIETSGHLRAEILRLFNQTFAVTDGIQLIAVVVAVLGVMATLISLILERRRDIAILRCLGTTGDQVMGMVLVEAFVLALCGVVLGLSTGFGLSWVLIHVINKQSFGWTLIFHCPTASLSKVVALILAATVVAASYPARLASQVEPATHLRDE
jgi:putative ABC transport system permease protein